MKNRDVTIDVLKAISIGIAATLALMPNATAFAAEGEGEPESSGNDTQEENNHEESHESSESQSVSEASESVAEAAAEMAQSEAPAAEEVSVAFTEAAETLGEIAADMAAVDTVQAAAEENAEYFNDMQHVADVSSGYAAEVTSEAADKAETASETVTAALSNAETSKESVSEAASVTYTSAAAAESAKSEASDKIDGVREELTESEAAVAEAQDKLDAASTALTTAEEAVDHAKQAKEAADTAAAKARDDFKKLLDDNGISYTEDESGNVNVDETAEISDGKIKSAIEKAQSAADKAAADAAAAQTELDNANTNAVNAAQTVVNSAKEKLKAAQQAYDASANAYTEDSELEDMLRQIQQQQEKVSEVVASKADSTTYWNTSRTLAFYIAKYMLMQQDDIDRSSIDTKYDNAGNVKKNNGAIEVSFKRKGSDVTEYAYYDTKAFYRDGDTLFTGNHNGVEDADHIVVIKKEVQEYNNNGTAKSFTKASPVLVSEIDINSGTDDYQRSKRAVDIAKAAVELAQNEKDAAETALAQYADIDAATTALQAAEAALAEAQGTFKSDERSEELITLIKAQREVVKAAKNTTQYWESNRELAAYLIEYTLRQQGELTSFEIARGGNGKAAWKSGNGAMNNYCIVKYAINGGEEQTAYFDYIAYYSNGETVSSTTQGTSNYIGESSIYKENSTLIPDHIVVVQKNAVRTYNDNGTPKTFSDKGTAFVDEADFMAGKDSYQRAKNRVASLAQAVNEAQSAVNIAKNIQTLKEQSAAADALKDKVEAARKKVNDAAAALQQARIRSSMNADMLAELTEKLADARAEYDDAVDELDTAKEKVAAIQTVIEEMEAALGTGFNYATPTAATGASGTSGGSSATSEGTSTATASVAAPAGGATVAGTAASGGATVAGTAASVGATAEAAGAEVLGERQAPASGGAGTESAAPSKSEVLGERQAPVAGDDLLEEGVLGERHAPIIQAYENGTFSRKMMFTEEGIKVSFLWWFIILVLGAKGVQMYAKSCKIERAKADKDDR